MANDNVNEMKGYSSLSFKLSTPKLTIFEDHLLISTNILRKKEWTAEGIAIDSYDIKDKAGNHFAFQPDDYFSPASGGHSLFTATIWAPKKKLIYSGANVSITLLTQNGVRVGVSFLSDIKGECKLELVKVCKMNAEDEARFISILNAYNTPTPQPATGGGDQPVLPSAMIPSIRDYITAINIEKTYLKQQGGRKYKVTNGKRISKIEGSYSYSFELETELYLSDDAPIKIQTTTGISTAGTVLVCDGFNIIVLLISDIGEKVSVGYVSVEPWKLLESLSERLKTITKSDKIAYKLLTEGPALSVSPDTTLIPKGQNAAKNMVAASDITVIWGPPGTGKTHTMAEIAIECLKNDQSVLIVSHSNISVDGVLLKVVELAGQQGLHKWIDSGSILRYGYVRDLALANNPTAVSFNFALGKSPSLSSQMAELLKQKAEASGLQQADKQVEIEKKIKQIKIQLKSEEQKYVKKAVLVATTVSKLYADKLFSDMHYDVVMFDEVSMAYVPQIVCAASFASKKLICVGDFRQLAPISQSDAKVALEKDLFTFLRITNTVGGIFAHPWLVMLNEQRRMHPDISLFVNKEVYRGLLKDHSSVIGTKETITNRPPFENKPLTLLDLTGTYCAAGKNSDNSRFNLLSALIAFGTALQAEEAGETSIGIITPYAAQTRLIRALLQDYRKHHVTNIACSTVHQFQGSERNLIIFDAVESYPSKKLGWLMSKNENNSISRLINVAITRAKGKLIVIANRGFWFKKVDNASHILYRLLQHILKEGNLIDVKEGQLKSHINSLRASKNLTAYGNTDALLDEFARDVQKTKERILISIPDDKLEKDFAESFWQIIRRAAERGIKIEIKVKNVVNLPEQWKSYCVQHDKALFPIILIDDKICWYGIPVSRGYFADGNSGFTTVLQTMLRVKGEHTVELVKSLSEIESAGNEINGGGENGGAKKPVAGFPRFIEEKEFCSNCKTPYKLMHWKNYYLKCPNCHKTKSLPLPDLRWYIESHNVRCPKDGGILTAKSGMYGIYVSCDHGHNLKPDDI